MITEYERALYLEQRIYYNLLDYSGNTELFDWDILQMDNDNV